MSEVSLDAFDSAAAVVGRTGSGKTFAAKGVVERLLDAGRRVCIVDPTGAWWGLRGNAGEIGGAYNVAIFGGDHADVEISEEAGHRLGEVIASGQVEHAIVDVSEMSTSGQIRFLTPFFEALYTGNRGALHLVLDEADLMAPQNPLPETRRLQGVVNKIVRRGRIKGFRPLMITQRPQVIDKSVLSQVDTLIAMRLTAPQDRKAILAWVQGHAGDAAATAAIDSLPGLKVGTGIVWRPSEGTLETVTFPPIKTFDSSRAPVAGEAPARPIAIDRADLDALRAELAPAPRIETQSIAARKTSAQVNQIPDVAAIEAEAERRGYVRGRESLLPAVNETLKMMEDWAEVASDLSDRIARRIEWLQTERDANTPDLSAVLGASGRNALALQEQRPPAQRPREVIAAPVGPTREAKGITGPQQHILDAIAWLNSIGLATPDKSQVAFLAGASSTSGGYANNLSALRTGGMIDYPSPGCVSLTANGRSRAKAPGDRLTHQTMLDAVGEKLSTPQHSILRALCLVWPHQIHKTALAETVGVSPTSGGYANNLSRLRTLGLITYPAPGEVRADDRMFPGGRKS